MLATTDRKISSFAKKPSPVCTADSCQGVEVMLYVLFVFFGVTA